MTDKNPRLDPDGTAPKVPGWISITEAGERLGYTRQHAFRLAGNGALGTLHRLGNSHTMCVSEEEIHRLVVAGENGAVRRRVAPHHEHVHVSHPGEIGSL